MLRDFFFLGFTSAWPTDSWRLRRNVADNCSCKDRFEVPCFPEHSLAAQVSQVYIPTSARPVPPMKGTPIHTLPCPGVCSRILATRPGAHPLSRQFRPRYGSSPGHSPLSGLLARPAAGRRANHTVTSAEFGRCAGLLASWTATGYCGAMGLRAPPPPSSPSSRLHTLAGHSAISATAAAASPADTPLSSVSSSVSSSSSSSSTAKISSQRTAQIARHLSTSSATLRSHRSLPTMASPFQVRKIGAPNTLEHRVYIEKDGVPVSPFHDVPLYANQEQTILNMIVEIPRWTNGKLEVC